MRGGLFGKPRKGVRGKPRINDRWTEAEFAAWTANEGRKPLKPAARVDAGEALAPVAKASKFKNRKCEHGGVTFDSGRELKHWLALVWREKSGEIRELERQVPFVLAESVDLGEKRRKPALRYYADFAYVVVRPDPALAYEVAGERVVADAKGKVLSDYRIKKHLMASVHNIIIREL